MKPKAKFCYEVSWEVCNKVGGIYTVVSSKAQQMISQYGKDNYCLIGPYFTKKAYGIFEEKVPPADLKPIFDKLKSEGIECHWGAWLIKGEPCTILVDFDNYKGNNNNIKKELWDKFQIDSMNTDFFDFDEPLVWATAVGRLLDEISKVKKDGVVAHCHEWLAGGTVLHLKSKNAKVATVFTTHATMLGRTIANSNQDLYGMLGKFDPAQKAKELGICAKYLMEKQCAHNAGAFTTVSEITGIEAEHLLLKKPDVLLFNGLDMAKFPTFEEISIKHRLFKNKVRNFILYYFFPYYKFDLDNTLFFFIAGRPEFHDKGIDVFINALGQLNDKLKAEKSSRNVVVFFFVPGNVKGIRQELLVSRTLFKDVSDTVDDDLDRIKHSLIRSLVDNSKLTPKGLIGSDYLDLKRKIIRFKREGLPPVSTHDLYEEDDILRTFKNLGLDNSEDDNVKVVYYPMFLTGADGLLDTSYYESMLACHLGVFPSYYEPWGYTPLEAGALGVPSVTTDLAGFGRYICTECEPTKNPGIFVLNRMKIDDAKTTSQLADHMYMYLNLSTQERVATKISARHIAEKADWKYFIKNYIEAHNVAVDKLNK